MNKKIYKEIKDLPEELWKPIEGFEDKFMVSNKGRIKSIKRTLGPKQRYRVVYPRLVKFIISPRTVIFSTKNQNGSRYSESVSRIVYKAFGDCSKDGLIIYHKNGDVHDNRIENLRNGWTGVGSYVKKGYRVGVNHQNASVKTEKHVKEIAEMYYRGYNTWRIAKKYNTSISTVLEICSGKSYKGVVKVPVKRIDFNEYKYDFIFNYEKMNNIKVDEVYVRKVYVRKVFVFIKRGGYTDKIELYKAIKIAKENR